MCVCLCVSVCVCVCVCVCERERKREREKERERLREEKENIIMYTKISLMTLIIICHRGVRTKTTPTSSSAGINELEGSVMLEADDYRRISNDVKSLKTALLKLKRELHSDVSLSVTVVWLSYCMPE